MIQDPERAHTADGVPVPDPGAGEHHDTGEPMTQPQHIHLEVLCREAGESFDPSLSKADADRRIAELERRLPGRGQS